MTYQSMDRPHYVVPALGNLYTALEAYSWPLARAVTGLFFLPHGMQKLFGFWGGDIVKSAEGFAKQGLEPSLFWAYYIGCLEFLGGICLILGLLTRPVAALFAGFMFVAALMSICRSVGFGQTGAWKCRSISCLCVSRS